MRETTNYMILGYAISIVIFAIIIGSIWWRYQLLAKDEDLLEKLEKDEFENRQTAEVAKDALPSDAKSTSPNKQGQTLTS